MRKCRLRESEIIAIIGEHEAGAKVGHLSRRHGNSGTALYNREAQFGGLDLSEGQEAEAAEG